MYLAIPRRQQLLGLVKSISFFLPLPAILLSFFPPFFIHFPSPSVFLSCLLSLCAFHFSTNI